jgi:hypothetical protein
LYFADPDANGFSLVHVIQNFLVSTQMLICQ